MSRRSFLKGISSAPLLFVPAPLFASPFGVRYTELLANAGKLSVTDFRLTPHYPTKSPLDDVLRLVRPGSDEYVSEKYASEIMPLLYSWSERLKIAFPAVSELAQFIDPSITAASLTPTEEIPLRRNNAIETFRRRFSPQVAPGRERFLQQIETYLSSMSRIDTAEFEITGIEEIPGPSPALRIDIRYDFVGRLKNAGREERVGYWRTQWTPGWIKCVAGNPMGSDRGNCEPRP